MQVPKEENDRRVAKTPERIEYDKKRFEQEGIGYILKNPSIGHFHLFNNRGELFQFWAGTGKIWFDKSVADKNKGLPFPPEERGVENVIRLIKASNKIHE